MKITDEQAQAFADEERLEMIAAQQLGAHLEDEDLHLWEMKGLGEEVPDVGVQGAGNLAESPDRRLALTVLEAIDRLCRDAGLSRELPRAHALSLSQVPGLLRIDHDLHDSLTALTLQGKRETM